LASSGGDSVPGLIGAVPPAAAPARTIYTIVHTFWGTYADLVITTRGQLLIEGAPPGPASPAVTDLSFVSLEGVSYRPGALFSHIGNLNTSSWSAVLSDDPGWVEDDAGIVHLQGAATQTSSSGSGADLVATMSSVIRPDRAVYTIVETSSGTYADLAIQPSGQIDVIAPRPPAMEDVGFLSLEGATYQPSASAGPHGLSLTRRGDVVALLRQPRALGLLVFKLGSQAHLLGAVTLGHAAAGRSEFRWRLRVNGRRLRAGTYLAELVARVGRGRTVAGSGVTFALAHTGRIRVRSSTCSVAAATADRC
jgi:hypothetical protein